MLQARSETGGGRNAVLTQVTKALPANHPIGGDRSRVSGGSSHWVIFRADASTPETRPPPAPEGNQRRSERTRAYLPRFLRWTRVLRSSLRCFFFDMRLRRFLMTEPMRVP